MLSLAIAFCCSLLFSVVLSLCVSLSLSGSLWLSLALCGSLLLSVALSGSLWLSLALCGALWLSVALCGPLWLSVALWLSAALCGLCGSLWLSVAVCRCRQTPGKVSGKIREIPGESGRGPRGGDFRKIANAMDETPIWSQTPRTATFDDDPEANTVHSDVLRRLRGENADVSNESGVFKSGVSRRRGIRRRVSRRRERRFLNASRTAVSRERCRFFHSILHFA